jgi:uroporphyrinogen decarboxylase
MTSRERFHLTLSRREADRVPMAEICFWPQTVERWRQEGLPADQEPGAFLGLDPIVMTGGDFSLRLPAELIEENEDWKIERDADGTTHKVWKTNYAPPQELDHLIKTREDFARHSERLLAHEGRIVDGVTQSIRDAHAGGNFCTFNPTEPVWWALRTLGMEHALITLAEDPGFFEEMVAAHAEMTLSVLRKMLAQGEKPDAIWFFSDLCYRNGMFFSPRSYREIMMPYHRQFADLCHEDGMFLILHCCGGATKLIPLLIESGFDCIQPLEARAGCDVRELKPLYGDQITFFGNMNMDVFATNDRELIRQEVTSKLLAAKPGGGYIYHSDHSVPPTISFDSYRYAVDLARELGQY